MRYLPLDKSTREGMLSSIGVKKIEDLYSDLPLDIMGKKNFNLPSSLTEQEVFSYLKNLSDKNIDQSQIAFFLGGGCYKHYIPALVDTIIQRSEFLTAYTPYQPEISQGTLQVIFEFQSMICELTGMEVSNASLYDGATSVVEAICMAKRLNKKKSNIVILEELNPDYLRVVKTYLTNDNILFGAENINADTCCVVIQTPDFYGTPHDISKLRNLCDENGSLLITVNTEIISLGLLPPPKESDIVVGEAQSIGVPMNFGGPHLGYLACKKKYTRQMPGRICGITSDLDGNRGFVLTLNAREQHIRREKATSNICSNQGLNVVAFTVHLAMLGSNGLKKLAKTNHLQTKKLYNIVASHPKIKMLSKSFFNEFTYEIPISSDEFLKKMLNNNIMAGIKVNDNRVLTTVTETNSEKDINDFQVALNKILG